MDYVDNYLMPHWMLVAGYFGLLLTGQFMKRQVWTKKAAATSKVMHWFRRTLAMHAPVIGLGIGAIPGIPVSPGVDGVPAAMLYWAGIGVLSSFSFHAISEFTRNRFGVDLEGAIEDAVSPSMSPPDGLDPND